MLSDQDLADALTEIPTRPLTAVAYRLIPLRYVGTALSSIGSLEKGGRYNPPGVFEALYLSEDPVTALQEVQIVRVTDAALFGVKSSPRILLSVELTLQAVLDVTPPKVQTKLGTNLQEMTASWLAQNASGKEAATQQLGRAAFEHGGIEALVVPSAQDPRRTNMDSIPRPVTARQSSSSVRRGWTYRRNRALKQQLTWWAALDLNQWPLRVKCTEAIPPHHGSCRNSVTDGGTTNFHTK